MPGPLPDPAAKRRNQPTVPTTDLPLRGRSGPIPKPPAHIALGRSGSAWWKWAWRTPQAAAWAPGMEMLVARRATLEDDLSVVAGVKGLDAFEASGTASDVELRRLLSRLAALASGRLQIMREMREIEDRLGLTPKGMAALRWQVVKEPTQARSSKGGKDEFTKRREARRSKLA